MDEQDIRWKQRLANFNKALSQLKKFIDHGKLNELEEQGLVQAFEYTYELAWNVVRITCGNRATRISTAPVTPSAKRST